jgi:hypothetical protein
MQLDFVKYPKNTRLLLEYDNKSSIPLEALVVEWTESGRYVKFQYLNGSFGWFDVSVAHKVLEVLDNE